MSGGSPAETIGGAGAEAGNGGEAEAEKGGAGGDDANCFGVSETEPELSSAGVSILFPPSVSYTDASKLTVRGRAWAPEGVARVEVAGVEATTTDGFANWSVEIPIQHGTHHYYTSFTDEGGEVTEQAAKLTVVNRGSVLHRVSALDFDAEREQLLIAGDGQGLMRLDLAEGRVSEVLADGEAAIAQLKGKLVAIDVARHRAIGANSFDELASVDLESGEGAILSDWNGSDPSTEVVNFSLASGLAIDEENERAFVLGSGGIVEVDLASGARAVIVATGFDGSDGEGLDDIVYDAVTDPNRPRLLVSDRASGSILAVDPMDGTSTPWLTGELIAPSRMKLDVAQGRLLVVDGAPEPSFITNDWDNQQQIVAVDLVDLTTQVLSGPDYGAGYLPGAPYALALDEARDRAYFADRYGGRITAVDLTTGDRTLVHDADVGAGLALDNVNSILLWPPAAPNLLLGATANHESWMTIELSNGDRAQLPILAPALSWPTDLVVEPAAGCARTVIALDKHVSTLVRLDLMSGEQWVITSPETAEGPLVAGGFTLGGPGLALDADGERVLATNVDDALLAVDLVTGTRTVIADAETGEGPALQEAAGVAWDDRSALAPRALVATSEGVVVVNPTTGDRNYLTGSEEGAPTLVRRVALSPDGSSLVALTATGLFSVDTITGASILLSGRASYGSELVGAGPAFDDAPMTLQVDFSRGIAYVLDIALMAIVAIDLTSGDRVLASH
jgi:hypothetical protein